jgi:hypothetical protein
VVRWWQWASALLSRSGQPTKRRPSLVVSPIQPLLVLHQVFLIIVESFNGTVPRNRVWDYYLVQYVS